MGCCLCISTGEKGIIEKFGKYDSVANPGCHCLIPCVQDMAGKISLRLQQLDAKVESKTKDNVFVIIAVTVQYNVLENAVEKAFYRLENPVAQIQSYVFNSIRGQVPEYELDQIFQVRKQIADAMKADLDSHMHEYGYDITAALITDIEPAPMVKNAMNQINTNARLKAAAIDKAEAEKIRVIKEAEAEAEAKRLSGVGLAEQRKAIVSGLQRSVENFAALGDLTSQEVMMMVLMNQYFDSIKDLAEHSKGSSMFIPHAPGGAIDSIVSTLKHGLKTR
jgi:regulator of protease activity HflC (stomatin/prohibitin superfamily)